MRKKKDSLRKYINVSETAARMAGDYIRDNMNKSLDITMKGRADMVTHVDKHAEKIILQQIRSHFPDHSFCAEESGLSDENSEYRWIIDPLDGTTNFVHGMPFVAVSIALEKAGELIVGVVYNPFLDEHFSAAKGQGSYLNGKPIHVSDTESVARSLLATGFPYELSDPFHKNMEYFKYIYPKSQGVRRAGSAALDLCYTACGIFDGFWELNLNAWDIAAGTLIVQEAGGKVTDPHNNDYSVYGRNILATNGIIHNEMLGLIQDVG